MVKGTEIPENRIRSEMDEIYKNFPQGEIPWNNETPPDQLVELVESGKIKPCKAIDLGCGTGNYSIYLAGKGFMMTGMDISQVAINIAKKNAKKKAVNCTFLAADVTGIMNIVNETFDFAFDWDVLHHVFPEKRKKYVANVAKLLNPGGSYLSVCFHEKDLQFGGSGKYRKTRLGTLLYFSSEQELKDLFESCFKILELKRIEISGKSGPHVANYVLMTRPERI
jgi:SAM-dependent methyltransferase